MIVVGSDECDEIATEGPFKKKHQVFLAVPIVRDYVIFLKLANGI